MMSLWGEEIDFLSAYQFMRDRPWGVGMFRSRVTVSAFLFLFAFSLTLSNTSLARDPGSDWVIGLETGFSPSVSPRLSFPFVPDPKMTTGSLCTPENPDFERYRYKEQIPYCKRNVSSRMKAAVYRRYGVSSHCKSEYTIDHFIPLSLGGTNEFNNLWPEPKSIKALRQNLEYNLYKRLSAGKITQAEAVREIVHAKLNPPVDDPSQFEFCR